ncbi:MAG: hypothetical protein ACPLVF_06250 [Thermovenabulum sp.]
MAEFFLTEEKEEKNTCYKAFKKNFFEATGKNALEHFKVPYENQLIRQDVLLLAGENDHYITGNYLYKLKRELVNARSVTADALLNRFSPSKTVSADNVKKHPESYILCFSCYDGLCKGLWPEKGKTVNL